MATRSATFLVYLHRLPRWALLVLMVGLLVSGLAVPGPAGAAPLLLLAVVLGWLAVISWPAVDVRGRVLRIVVPLALTAFAAARIAGV